MKSNKITAAVLITCLCMFALAGIVQGFTVNGKKTVVEGDPITLFQQFSSARTVTDQEKIKWTFANASSLRKITEDAGAPLWMGGAWPTIPGTALSAARLTTPRDINGVPFDGTADITVTDSTKEVAGVAATADTAHLAAFVHGDIAHANRSVLNLVSGTNTGDETLATIKSKLGVTTLSGSNTGDQTSVTGNAGTVTNGIYTTSTNVVSNAILSQMASKTYKGRTSALTGNAEDVPVATLKADLALAKSDVGLGSVDNTADSAKPVSTVQQAALDLKANLASPTFTGVPAAPTAAVATNTTQIATTAFVNAEISNDAAPLAHVGSGGAAHADVTTAIDGFMLAADKVKLDGVATGANNYTHPSGDGNLHVIATSTTNNGKVLTAGATAGSLSWATPTVGTVTSVTGTGPVVSSGGATPAISMAAATASVNGYMTNTYATKLDGIAANATNYTHPTNHPASIITQDVSNRFATDAEKAIWSAKEPAIVAGTTAQYLRGDKSLGTFATDALAAAPAETATTIKAALGISTLTGSNTGDNAANSLYSGLVSNAAHTGDATGSTALTVVKIQGVAVDATAPAVGDFLRNDATGWKHAALVSADIPNNAANTTGSAAKLTTARTINGVSFDGTANITVADATKEVAGVAAAADTAHTTAFVHGDIAHTNRAALNLVSGTNTGDQTTITGNAGTATKLATGRTIAITGPIAYTSPSFDGSGNVTAAATVTSQTGTGSKFVMDTSPVLVTPSLGVASGTSLTLSGNIITNGENNSFSVNNGTTNSLSFRATGWGQAAYWLSNLTFVGNSDPPNNMTYTVNPGTYNTGGGALRFDGNNKTWAFFTAPVSTGAGAAAVLTRILDMDSAGLRMVSLPITASNFSGPLTGNASTATKLVTPRTINGVAFDGTTNITVTDATKVPLSDSVPVWLNPAEGATVLYSLPAYASVSATIRYNIKNIGQGIATIDATDAKTIDDAALLDLAPGDRCELAKDGTNWQSL